MVRVAALLIGAAIVVGGCGDEGESSVRDLGKNPVASKEFECSDLTQKRWEELRSKEVPPRALTGFAQKLQECKTLVGRSPKEVLGFLGKPDREGKVRRNSSKEYASWVVGVDRMFGDEIVLTAVFNKGEVIRVEPVR